jgi:hypothetical protein
MLWSSRYHWALVVGPKENGTSTRFHAKEQSAGRNAPVWVFEERDIDSSATEMLLVRVMIAKVKKKDRLQSIVRKVPVRQGATERNDIVWIQEALRSLEADGKTLGRGGVTEWTKVRNTAMDYCKNKRERHSFHGEGHFDMPRVPTWDLTEGKEIIS